MPHRIGIGELAHETNTFCPEATSAEAFRSYQWLVGDQVASVHRGTRTYVGGMLDAAEELGVEAVPTFVTSAVPSGTITAAAYGEMSAVLLDRIRAAMPLDGLCLSLHGAGVAEGADDLEADLLARVRGVVGSDLPIALALDLHGNVTPEMGRLATGMFGVNFYPHTDMHERGAEAMRFLTRVLGGEIRPVTHVEQLPMMIPTCSTDLEPGRRLNELCWEWEKTPGLLDCTIFHGFPYTDVPAVGMSVVTTADGDAELAARAARAVADAIRTARDEYLPKVLGPADAIAHALALGEGPVVINDTSDNPGGGAPGDSTHLLRAMVEAGLDEACIGVVFDPETALQAHAAGVGATIRVRVGGKSDAGRPEPLHGAPLEATAYVKALTDGRFRLTTPMGRGGPVDMGRMARLVIGQMDVLVSERRQQVFDDEVFLLHGIDVRRYRIVAVKSSNHFRAGFNHIARAIVTADAPGATTLRLNGFPYRRIRRPIWPLD